MARTLVSPRSQTLPIKPFAKGHDADALGLALQIPNRQARRDAIATVRLYGSRKLVNPSAGWGAPSTAPSVGTPPDDESLETACELAEIAGAMILADTDLAKLGQHPDAIRLTDTLLALGGTSLVEPRPGGLFRMNAGRLGGRIPSLFSTGYRTGWAARAPYNPSERMGFYGTTRTEWEALQDGSIPIQQALGEPMPRFASTGRGWASLADQDPPITIPETIARELVITAGPSSRFPPLRTESGFVSYGGLMWLQGSIGQASLAAMDEAWRLKWLYRRQRPEELWPRAVAGELHPDFLQHAGWLVERFGSYLPMIYAPGSPLHPDWVSGHAVLAGAGFTILKATFADQPYQGSGSLHRELDLAAWLMSFGRLAAGIHTRSSLTAGLMLGQHHAIQLLNQQTANSTLPLGDTVFLGFNGQMVRLAGT